MDDAIQSLWDRYLSTRSNASRNALVEHYLPLATAAAQRLHSHLPESIDADDLAQAAVFGLMDAIASFDPVRRVPFAAHARLRMRGAMKDWLRSVDYLPRLMRRRLKALSEALFDLSDRLGRPPTDAELRARLGCGQAELDRFRADADRAIVNVPLDEPIRTPEERYRRDNRLSDLLEDPRSPEPCTGAIRRDLLAKICRGLSREDGLIVQLFAIDGCIMREVADAIGLSESRISQRWKLIVDRLRSREDLRQLAFAGCRDQPTAAPLRPSRIRQFSGGSKFTIKRNRRDLRLLADVPDGARPGRAAPGELRKALGIGKRTTPRQRQYSFSALSTQHSEPTTQAAERTPHPARPRMAPA